MALETIKSNFEQLVDDKNNSVIALSGHWGTGKTYLWKEFQKRSSNPAVTDAIYVSLFGIRKVGELKLKIMQGAFVDEKKNKSAIDAAKVAYKGIKEIVRVTTGRSIDLLDDVALLAAPSFLRNRLIVIDDIERKHKDLDIDEVLGFIDEAIQIHNSRILLILNSDQLADKPIWEKMREKLIDHEITLDITAGEAFEIAVTSVASRYAGAIRQSVEVCKVNNIRVIQRIIRTVNRLLAHRHDLQDADLQRVIPSTCLLAALHYKGIQGGPPIEFVLSFNQLEFQLLEADRRRGGRDVADAEVEKTQERWRELLDKLDIPSCDEYETLVVKYLRSGLVDIAEVDNVLNLYVRDSRREMARKRVDEFIKRDLWTWELTEEQLLQEAEALIPYVHLVDPYKVTTIFETVQEYKNGEAVGNAIISRWLDNFNQNPPNDIDFDPKHDPFGRQVHPAILAAFDALRNKQFPLPSIFEVAQKLDRDLGRERRDGEAMRQATPDLYVKTIRSLTGDDLKIFMRANIDLILNERFYADEFGGAMDNFLKACRTICRDDPSSRLARVITLTFKSKRLQDRLQEQEAAAAG